MSKYEEMLDELPTDWTVSPISDLGQIVSGGTPSREVSVYWKGDTPWVTPGEISKLDRKYIDATNENITDQGLKASGANLLPSGSLLVTSRATLGARAVNSVPMSTNQGFKSIIFNRDTDTDFYYHFFEYVISEMERRASGTTFLEISGKEFSSIRLPVPAEDEKREIANILDTLDTQIRQTEAIIAKLQQVKQGLLHDLLTRGIDANGQLRPPRDQAPELYKESPLGWIPREWEVGSLNELCSSLVDCPHTTPKYQDEGVYVARTMHIKNGEFLQEQASRVSEGGYLSRIDRLEPRPGDIIFTREAPVGEAFVIPEGMRICLGQRVMVMRPKSDSLHSEFLLHQIYSGEIQRRMKVLTAGTTNPHLNVADVREMLIPVPPLNEQTKIGDFLDAQKIREKSENIKIEKLKKQKSGLMDDLLTGRVRVTSLLDTAKAS